MAALATSALYLGEVIGAGAAFIIAGIALGAMSGPHKAPPAARLPGKA